MNKFSDSGARRLSLSTSATGHRVNDPAELQRDERYGMTDLERTTYIQDCRESEQFCTDAHTYFLNHPDVLQNFF